MNEYKSNWCIGQVRKEGPKKIVTIQKSSNIDYGDFVFIKKITRKEVENAKDN